MNFRSPRPRLRACLAGALILVLLLAGCSNDGLEEHLNKGRQFFTEGNFEDAQLEGLYVLIRDPENEEALRMVARSLLAQDRDGEAEGYFKRLTERNPFYAIEAAQIYDQRAREDYDGGERNRATRRWSIALRFEPRLDIGPFGFHMASRAYDDRDWSRAAQLYGRALAAYPDTAIVKSALYPYSVSLQRLERGQEALTVLEPFLKRYPRHRKRHEAIWLYQELLIQEARAANGRMDYEGAVEYLRKALRHRENPPMTAEALLELGSSYESLQDYETAASCYRRVIEESSTHTGRIYDAAVDRLSKLEKARLK